MKSKIIRVIKNLEPELFDVKEIKIKSFKKLGTGEGNLNYVFQIENKKFICRINIDPKEPRKTIREYKGLKLIENLKIAPKVFYLHKPDKEFPYGFIILEFIEGRPFRMKQRKYTSKQIKNLARILAKLHNKKPRKLPKSKYSYSYYLDKSKKYIRMMRNYTTATDSITLEFIHKKIKEVIPKKEKHKFGLIHGDVCPQNIIQTRKGLKSIDWESIQYSDPAKDIANVMVDLGIKGKHLEIFMNEYLKYRKDKDILKRAKVYSILFRYTYFLWEIVRAFEIINKELPEDYLKKTTPEEHIKEAKYQFRQLKEIVNLPNLNIDGFFVDAKN